MARFSFVPQEMVFFDLFKKDIANAVLAALALQDLVTAYVDVHRKAREIKAIEHDGDTITHEIFRTLNQTFVTPIDREDIYALATSIDDVVDLIEAVADACVLYRVNAPTQYLREGVEVLVAAVHELQKALDLLSTFRGLEPYWVAANSLENQADQIYRAAIGHLFANGSDATDILRWKGVYDLLEDANDKCEDVANIIESITIKHA